MQFELAISARMRVHLGTNNGF
ncbi:hypothetical protein MTR67_044660 [Solanum verrucosum]|uniref:Uncharacterized protein n=1 Tax=Solanum verrucosum TaxID=315347 RepID=A0AAF0ZVV6_SOLVR|nr:hypothetical protein MTR67_044660 [Solanum verrucosum]